MDNVLGKIKYLALAEFSGKETVIRYPANGRSPMYKV